MAVADLPTPCLHGAQSTGVPVTLGNVTVPDTQAPTFLYLDVTKDTSRLALGFFSLEVCLFFALRLGKQCDAVDPRGRLHWGNSTAHLRACCRAVLQLAP